MILRSELIAAREIKATKASARHTRRVTAAKAGGMVYLWRAVAEQIVDPEAMRAHVVTARALGACRTFNGYDERPKT
jgi:hypothetical protein